jgi:hypothetical protein
MCNQREETTMNIGIFTFGVLVTAMVLLAFGFTMNEFRKMGKNPTDYKNADAYKNRNQ